MPINHNMRRPPQSLCVHLLVATALATVTSAAPEWTLLPNTRCHNDFVQWHAVANLSACEAMCATEASASCHLFTYCPAEGAPGCTGPGGPLPLDCWGFQLQQLPNCEPAPNWTSGWYPTPTPPPPVPPPADWQPRVDRGDMAYTSAGPDDIGEGLFPVLGNGFLAIETGPFTQLWQNAWPWRDAGTFHLAGVLTGLNYATPSHAAQIPKIHDMVIVAPGSPLGAAVDYSWAAYFNRTRIAPLTPGCMNTDIEQRSYAHRSLRELFVFEMRAFASNASLPWSGCSLPVRWSIGPNGHGDLDLTQTALGNASYPAVWSGTTLEPEEPGLPLRSLAVVLDSWAATGPTLLNFTPSAPLVAVRAVIRSDLDVAPDTASPSEVAAAAVQTWMHYTAAFSSSELMFAAHTDAWAALWSIGGVELSGNASLAAIVNASSYDILSSLRADWDWGTSPGGLGTGAYNRHAFWDMETWMFPILALLHPALAASAARYRISRLAASQANAAAAGYDGAMWAWESAYTGQWASPDRDCDFYENHISADIPLAMRKLYYSTGDAAFLETAWPTLNQTCRFWECRFRRTDSPAGPPPPGYAPKCSPKGGSGNWTVYGVMPPDESAGITNSSIYTNAAAAQTLGWCVEAAGILGLQATIPLDLWADMSAHPYMPVADTLFAGGPVHVQDEHYTKPRVINQADVALLQYPLGLTFDEGLMERDLSFYASQTNFAGMFTGDSSYSCAFLALGNRTAADKQMDLAFQHLSSHFHVFTETAISDGGHSQHFITGAGGYLQSFVFGYSGLRVEGLGVLSFTHQAPVLPPLGVTEVKLRGLHLLGIAFDFWWDATTLCAALQPPPLLHQEQQQQQQQTLQLRVVSTGKSFELTATAVCVPVGPVLVAGIPGVLS